MKISTNKLIPDAYVQVYKYKQYQNAQVSSTNHYIKIMTLMKLIEWTIQQII